MKNLEQLVNTYQIDVNSFNKAMSDFMQNSFAKVINNQLVIEKDIDADTLIQVKLWELLSICIKEAKIENDTRIMSGYLAEDDISMYAEDYKSNNHYSLKISQGILLVGDINGENLRYANDKVWLLMAKLIYKYNTKFQETGEGMIVRNQYPQLFRKNTTFIRIMRNYYMHEILYGKVKGYGPLWVHFNINSTFEDLIPEIVDAFCIFSNINRLLYRASIK